MPIASTSPAGINPAARQEPTIKWPNDILVAGKKIAGILIEQRTIAGSLAAVVGIGLNVRQTAADFAELPDATSIEIATGWLLDTEDVCRALLRQLDEDYAELIDGRFSRLSDRWQRRLGLAGNSVRAECVDRVVRGRLLEVSLFGVVLQVDDDLVHLPPETIRHLRADDAT
jgi:BirA family biotin operon repressor/biotin-[acetyl-CoA-carboxylase] ligase